MNPPGMTMDQARNLARMNQGVRNMGAIRRYGGPIDPLSDRRHASTDARRYAREHERRRQELLMLSTAVKNATRKHRGVPKRTRSKKRRSASGRLMRDSGWIAPTRGMRRNFPPQQHNNSVATTNNLGNRSRSALLFSKPYVERSLAQFL
jgi:hypothetical protein